jgi:hypothetical protein
MTTVSSEQGLRELLERVAEMEEQNIRFNEMTPKFLWFDEDDALRLMGSPNIDVDQRPKLAWALQVLTAAQHEDTTLVYIFDGYHASANAEGKMVKKDGTDWGYGGMQYAIQNQTEDMDLVSECLNVTAAQNGWVAMCMVPYDRTGDGITFRWDDVVMIRESPDEPRGGAAGDFPTMIREATAVTRMSEAMAEEGVDITKIGLELEQAKLHMICAAVKFVGTAGAQIEVAIPARSEAEVEVLNSSFGDTGAKFFDGETGDEVDTEGNPVSGEPDES